MITLAPVSSSLVLNNVTSSINPDILSTPPFKEILGQYKGEEWEKAVGLALTLLAVATPEEVEHIPKVLAAFDLKQRTYSDTARIIIRFLEQIQNVKFEESATQIAQLAFERLKDVMFHGTHIRHLKSICEHGLSTKLGGHNPKADQIQAFAVEVIGKRHGEFNLFGWRYSNCRVEKEGRAVNRIALWPDPEGALFWATASPEWFYYFTSQEHKDAPYLKRDKVAAQKYLEERIEYWTKHRNPKLRPLTPSEADELRQFFEETWEYYKELRPVVFKVVCPSSDTPQQLLEGYLQLARGLYPKSLAVDQTREALTIFLRQAQHESLVEEDIPPQRLTPFIIPV